MESFHDICLHECVSRQPMRPLDKHLRRFVSTSGSPMYTLTVLSDQTCEVGLDGACVFSFSIHLYFEGMSSHWDIHGGTPGLH